MPTKYIPVINKGAYSAIVYIDGSYYVAEDFEGNLIQEGTDAATVIQAAINKVFPGGTLHIAKGDYNISTSISLDAVGYGYYESLITADKARLLATADVPIFITSDDAVKRTKLTLRDLTFKTEVAYLSYLIDLINITDVNCENLTMWAGTGNCIRFRSSIANIWVEKIINSRLMGAVVVNFDNVTDSFIHNNHLSGKTMLIGNSQVVTNNDIVVGENDNGIEFPSGSRHHIITNNWFDGGIDSHMSRTGISATNIDSITISNNVFWNLGRYGIYNKNGSTFRIINNEFYDCNKEDGSYSCILFDGVDFVPFNNKILTNSFHVSHTYTNKGYWFEEKNSGVAPNLNIIAYSIGDTAQFATPPVLLLGTSSRAYANSHFITENTVLSDTFAIDTLGVKTVTIPHGLAITPATKDCHLTVVENTDVDDWGFDMLKVESTDATNVVAKIKVSTTSGTTGATAKLALRIGKY